jgi:Cof subfamily protein (haloacid dehalogenase superfamily)
MPRAGRTGSGRPPPVSSATPIHTKGVGYELLVCDLDGTLIDHSMALEPALVAAFKRAAAAGLGITIATGRMPLSVDFYREALDVRLPIIYYNGGLIRDTAGMELLRCELPRGILARVREVFSAAPVHPIFFRDEQLYCLDRTLPIRQFCDDEGLRAHVIPDPEDFLRLGAFMKGLFIGHQRDLVGLRADLEGLLEDDARLVHTAEHYLELLPVASTKGAALAHLAAHLGVPLARVVAVGDHDNDIEMVEVAGLGVAMAHAPASVRAVADRVAPAPADGGLLRLLAEILPESFGASPSGG